MSLKRAHLEIPPSGSFLEPATAFVLSYASRLGTKEETLGRLRAAFEAALSLILDHHTSGGSESSVALEAFEAEGELVVEMFHRGVPILFHNGSQNPSVFRLFREASRNVDGLFIENCGRQGQKFVLKMKLGPGAIEISLGSFNGFQRASIPIDGKISMRLLQSGEEAALSRLFYFVYGYNYINEFVYYPEKIQEMIQKGSLISVVASTDKGDLVGHVGLVKQRGSPPVYEAALGVVDPHVKSRGLFGRMFQNLMEIIQKTPMQYCFFDFVTNHSFSQNLISRYGTCDTALFVGCQSRSTQASLEKLGLGPDPEGMDRYTILFSILPRLEHPFGKEVVLPHGIGEPLEFLLEPLGLSWVPASRFWGLPPEGSYTMSCQPTQSSVVFDLFSPGVKALEGILKDFGQLLRDGYQYAAVELPLEEPGLGQVYDILSSRGFFVGGFVPYHLTDKLGFRFQAIGPTKVAFEKIQVSTESGRRLLEVVKKDYKRNCLI